MTGAVTGGVPPRLGSSQAFVDVGDGKICQTKMVDGLRRLKEMEENAAQVCINVEIT